MKTYVVDALNRSTMGKYLDSVEAHFIDECLKQEPQVSTILDAGGGAGRVAIPLGERGYNVIVTEVQFHPLQLLKLRSPSTPAILTPRRSLPLKDASRDCILAIGVPFAGAQWFWRECRRVLKPGGMIIVTSANSNSYKKIFNKTYLFLRPFLFTPGKKPKLTGFYPRSAHAFVQIFEQYDFRLEQALGYNWLPFNRASNSSLVPPLAKLEQRLGLRQFPFQSPWVIFKVKDR